MQKDRREVGEELIEALINTGPNCFSELDIFSTIKQRVSLTAIGHVLATARRASSQKSKDSMPDSSLLKSMEYDLFKLQAKYLNELNEAEGQYATLLIIEKLLSMITPVYDLAVKSEEMLEIVIYKLAKKYSYNTIKKYLELYSQSVDNDEVKSITGTVNSEEFWTEIMYDVQKLEKIKLYEYATQAMNETRQ